MASPGPVIIVGAGIGGLTTAAGLGKLGIPSIMFEKTGFLGGRCSTRRINGNLHEIGAIYIGGGVFDRLRDLFDLGAPSVPVSCGIKIDDGMISFPFGFRTVMKLRACGVSLTDMLRMKFRSRVLSRIDTFKELPSVGDVFDFLTDSPALRKVFHATSGLSGISPYCLPGAYMYTKGVTSQYRSLNPEYLASGNGGIGEQLLRAAKETCKIILNTEVTRLVLADNAVQAIETKDGAWETDVVVSNAGLKNTVLRLTDTSAWPAHYYEEVRQLGDTLQVVNVFLTFSRSYPLPKGHTVFLMSYDMNKEFGLLESGRFPVDSMFILHVPSNIEGADGGEHRATLQFYYPGKPVSLDLVAKQADRIVRIGLNDLFEGLSDAIIDYTVYDPQRYEKEFGFPPYVFGTSPDLKYRRFSIRTPVDGLFCVGDSVEPDGPCVAQAMESGLACASMIAHRRGLKLPLTWNPLVGN